MYNCFINYVLTELMKKKKRKRRKKGLYLQIHSSLKNHIPSKVLQVVQKRQLHPQWQED